LACGDKRLTIKTSSSLQLLPSGEGDGDGEGDGGGEGDGACARERRLGIFVVLFLCCLLFVVCFLLLNL
jgi:hypothetical protein